MSSAIVKHGDKYRLYNKGAAEWVLKRCTHILDNQGHVSPMSSEVSDELASTVTEMAKRGLRCICLTYTDYESTDASRCVCKVSYYFLLLNAMFYKNFSYSYILNSYIFTLQFMFL